MVGVIRNSVDKLRFYSYYFPNRHRICFTSSVNKLNIFKLQCWIVGLEKNPVLINWIRSPTCKLNLWIGWSWLFMNTKTLLSMISEENKTINHERVTKIIKGYADRHTDLCKAIQLDCNVGVQSLNFKLVFASKTESL